MPDHLLLPDRVLVSSRRQLGGGGRPPVRNPHRHGQRLRERVQEATVAAPRVPLEGVDPGLVFKIKARGRIEPTALETRDLSLLGETREWTYFVFSEQDAPQRFMTALSRYAAAPDEEGASAPLSSLFGMIEDLEPYGPEDRRGPGIPEELDFDEPMVVDVVIWPSPDWPESRRRIANARVVVEQFGGQELAADERPQFTILRARLSGHGLRVLLDLAVVERIRTPPTPFIEPSDWMGAAAEELARDVRDSEPIGVLDDGIADGHPLLAELVRAQYSFPADYPWRPIGAHGTMVAGLCAYGDFERPLAEGLRLVGTGPIYGGRVLEPHPDFPDQTRFATTMPEHQVIEEAIRTLNAEHGVRVFNVSIAYPDPYVGPHVGLMTELLDTLVRELGIVVIVATGNSRTTAAGAIAEGLHAFNDYPRYLFEPSCRVAEPAVGALAVTVGSIARSDAPQTPGGAARPGDRAVAGIGEISPFSRSGPGAANSVKPDFVAYGGNWVLTDTGRIDQNNLGVGVVSTTLDREGRLFQMASGTSFAAPRVTRIAADVWAAYPEASANLVRCLLGLAARVPDAVRGQFPDGEQGRRSAGNGMPRSDFALESGGNRVVMYFDGAIGADSVAIHPLPMPEDFARGRTTRRIAAALSFDPPVRRQRREYLAGTMTFDLLRAVDIDQVRDIYRRQDEEREAMLRDRRRVSLHPGSTRVVSSTLQVREWRPREMNVDDGDTYYLVVTHRKAQWGSDDDQTYAVAVELVEEARLNIDLYNLVQQRVRIPVRARVRAR